MNLYEKYILAEQGMPSPEMMQKMMGGGGPGGPGGPGDAPAPTIDDKFFDKVKNYPKIDAFIQQMQQGAYSDAKILDEIYKKFYPEFVYFAKELLQAENKPKPEGGPGGPGGPPGMPGAGGPAGAPMGAGG